MNTYSNRYLASRFRAPSLARTAGSFVLAALAVAAAGGCQPSTEKRSAQSSSADPDGLIFAPPLFYPITYVPGTTFLRTNQVYSNPPIALADSKNFVFTMADYDHDGVDDLYCVKTLNAASNRIEVHVLSGASGFSTFLAHQTTPLVLANGPNFTYLFGDYNHDNVPDLYAIMTKGTNYGVVEVWVYNGADQYQTVLSISYPTIHTDATNAGLNPSIPTGSVTAYGLGDADGDGNLDLLAIATHATPSGFVEVSSFHLFDRTAAAPYSYPVHTSVTPYSAGQVTINDSFGTGDYNHDGHPNLLATEGFISNTHSVELHVWDGASDFKNVIAADGSDIKELDGLNYVWTFGNASKADRFMSVIGVRRGFPANVNPADMEIDVLNGPAWCMAGPKGQYCTGYSCCDSTLACNGVQCLEAGGQACTSASDCAGGACIGGACTTCTPGGQAPSSGNSAQCCAGTSFAGGICVKPCTVPTGGACTVTVFNGALVKGGCQHGTATCHTDGTILCTPSAPKAETCNQIDDDCDGKVDNLPTTACTVTVNGGCSVTTGHNVCVNGAPQCQAAAGTDYCTRCGQTVNGASCGNCGSCSTSAECVPNTVCAVIDTLGHKGCKQETACSNNVACWMPPGLLYNRCLACFSPFPVPPGGGGVDLCGGTSGGSLIDGGQSSSDVE